MTASTALVETWLSGIGLSYALPSFEAAGIVTPEALAELDVTHFAALGVRDANDRRKLFFLVQRIKVAQQNNAQQQDKNQVEQVVARSPPRGAQPNHDDDQEDSDWDDSNTTGGYSDDDEASSPPERLQEQPPHAANRPQNSKRSSLLPPKRGTLSNSDSDQPRRRYSAIVTDSKSHLATDKKKTQRRMSGLQAPRQHRSSTTQEDNAKQQQQQPLIHRQTLSKSMRTGKPLRAIPAHTIAPMSPLVDLPQDTNEHSQQKTKKTTKISSSTSLRRRASSVDSESEGSMFSSSSSRITSRNGSANEVVSYQGQKTDNSFKTQIARLREENTQEHEIFADGTSTNADEMRIRVVVRKRPMSKAEIAAAGDVDVVHPLDYGHYGRVLLYQPRTRVDLTKEIETLPFAFDNVFDETSTNQEIYERCVRNLIPPLFDGQWGSIFAYGQTASGKTFTMMGSNFTGHNAGSTSNNPANLGLYYMVALDIFQVIQIPEYQHFSVGVSLFEIYGGKLFDLLNDRRQIKCLEDSKGKVCFPGLSEHKVKNADQLMELMEVGATHRSTGTTSRNADSSRSHAVIQLHLRTDTRREQNAEHSRLTLIDLAGSERGADTTSANRATRLEGAEINTSLLALKEVIRALATGDSMTHVPFRGSKLTQVLKESFVGINCKSVMIACISPNIGNYEQTLNTLRYADRVKERNAESGELSVVVATKNKRTNASYANLDSALNWKDGKSRDSSSSLQSDSSDVLDELLGSPIKSENAESATPSDNLPESADPRKNARTAANQIVQAHKAAMPTMLDMVKDEMALVNEADTDREGLEDYITKLADLHEKQLELFATIRDKIQIYRSLQPADSNVELLLEDCSFVDDLRD